MRRASFPAISSDRLDQEVLAVRRGDSACRRQARPCCRAASRSSWSSSSPANAGRAGSASPSARTTSAGQVIGTVASFIDVTESKVQEEHLRIVLKELAHRSKNLLSVIQGIARQTAENASSTAEFLSRFNGRIFSLSRAHDILTDADWRGARIFDLVQSQMALYAEDRLASVDHGGRERLPAPERRAICRPCPA